MNPVAKPRSSDQFFPVGRSRSWEILYNIMTQLPADPREHNDVVTMILFIVVRLENFWLYQQFIEYWISNPIDGKEKLYRCNVVAY